jgi:hypothetical protein
MSQDIATPAKKRGRPTKAVKAEETKLYQVGITGTKTIEYNYSVLVNATSIDEAKAIVCGQQDKFAPKVTAKIPKQALTLFGSALEFTSEFTTNYSVLKEEDTDEFVPLENSDTQYTLQSTEV